ncbi:MAG: hypothetical protein R2875_03595 [Desulfobacterales bacterium]
MTKRHLTARQAGEIAGMAGDETFLPCCFSRATKTRKWNFTGKP